MAIDATRDGDRCTRDDDRSTPRWRSFHLGMAIDASRDGDRCIGGGNRYTRSGVAASLVGYRCISRFDHVSRDGYHCISGWRSLHPRMAIIASRDGAIEMTIDASRDGNRSIPEWLSLHPRMAMDASRDGDRGILGWLSIRDALFSQRFMWSRANINPLSSRVWYTYVRCMNCEKQTVTKTLKRTGLVAMPMVRCKLSNIKKCTRL